MRMYGRRRRQLSPEEQAANAKRKEDLAKTAMTCQICLNKQQAKKGVIAHHGYTRPWEGTQTASCYGARALPYENSRTILGEYITSIENSISHAKKMKKEVEDEKKPAYLSYERYEGMGQHKFFSFEITRENFAKIYEENKRDFIMRSLNKFEAVKERDLADRERKLTMMRMELKRCKRNYDEWKHTHNYNSGNEKWEKI